MAKWHPPSLEHISSEVWENTPEPVKQLVQAWLAGGRLSESDSQLIQFLDATPIGIAVHDITGQLIYVNQIGRSLIGIDFSSAENWDQICKLIPIYREGTQELYPKDALPSMRALAGVAVWADDLEIRQSDRVLPLEVWATPIFNENGQVSYVIAAFQDVGERKRQEAERKRQEIEQQILANTLLKSEQRYRQVIQSQTDLILRSRPDTTITFANEALCHILGKDLETVIGLRWYNFVPPEETAALESKIAALTPENPIFENINQDYRVNNQIGWTQWVNLGIFDEHHRLIEIQSVGRDITQLQEKILREQALNRVLQAIRNSLDLNTIFTTATAEAAQLLGMANCSVVKYLPDQGVWRHVAVHQQDPSAPSTLGLEIPDASNPFATQLKQFRNVRVEDTNQLDDPVNREVAQTLPGAWLLIPLVIDGNLWGAFTLSVLHRPYVWRDDQIALAEAIAGQLEVAIQQANLYRQVQLELEERCWMEAALRESEARFQNMAANVPGAIFRYLLRPDGTDSVLYMSTGCFHLWEVEAQAVVADTTILWHMIHPEDRPAVYNSVMESARTLEPWSFAWRITTPSGREKWLEASGRPKRSPNGDVIWDTLVLDVSDRKRNEAERQQSAIALMQSEQRFRQLFETIPAIAVQGYNRHRKVIYWNQASEQVYGYTKAEAMGRQLEDLIIPAEMRQDVVQAVQRWVTDGEAIPASELSLLRKDGARVSVFSSHVMLTNAAGELEMYCVDIDLSDRKQAKEALQESESRYRLLAENMNDLVCLHDVQGRYLYVSPSCEALLGYQYEEMIGQDAYNFLHPDDRDRIFQEAHSAVTSGKPTPITYRIRQKSGHYIWFETLTKPILDAAGDIVQLQTTSRDVTERIQAQNRLKHDALHDALTGLPNRHLLMERLELAIHRAKRLEDYRFAVLFLDLDRFKVINDSLGHLAGDQLLIAIAQRLRSTLRSLDLAARLGGDEFVILIEEIKDIQEAVRATERIFAALQAPFSIEGREVYTSSSIGIVLGSKDTEKGLDLLRDADIAMYRAKVKGKARYEIFDADMHAQALSRLHLENDLRRAIAQEEFVLHYQPIVSLNTGCLLGFEALIRWQHPQEGLKPPSTFIAIAEETGLITRLDFWALRTACEQLAVWQSTFPELNFLKVSVNLSAQDLRRSDLTEEVDRILLETGLEGCYLTLEITESMLIEDVESTITLLSQLKQRNIQISIDDFGTGYSSLNYLHRLPVDNLKVDRSFVNQIQTGKCNHQIVETIIALSNQLELDAIAEGIETQHQLEQLKYLGYKQGQGYRFSKPLSREAVYALLAHTSPHFHLT
ncbi:bifunctional diguanylate cyclase/phosphodiesterase [Leptolyngbya sp. AN02str]|uniref:bifunctional diguanylate cyclase/phosphodiesterase n=1 Tax=Leptolyngbya sp. AN02str TaxID=3423363 RepID=UPI003D31E1E1